MQINEVAYKWAGQLTRRTATRRIILHHAAAVTCTPQQVHQWHLANGWTGIGYHFFVRKDGTVYRGRPEDTVGAHAGNNNYDSLGVCFEGSFDRETMPDAQLRAGQELVAYLKQKYGISTVQRHSDVNATGCPGDNFPFDALAGAQTAKPAVPARRSCPTLWAAWWSRVCCIWCWPCCSSWWVPRRSCATSRPLSRVPSSSSSV